MYSKFLGVDYGSTKATAEKIMPSLSETSTPILERDKKCGLIPPRYRSETDEAYWERLARLYHADVKTVKQCLQ